MRRLSYGWYRILCAYIPFYRIKRETIFSAIGWFNASTAGVAKGERSVANFDEDSITMAVAAAQDCLHGFSSEEIDGISFASTTAPYLERQNATICAEALMLRPNVRTADFSGSTRSGTTALLAAFDAIKAESSGRFLVSAADCRQGKPGSKMEHNLGDGAAALLVGNTDVIAELKGTFSLSRDFPDFRRIQGERFVRSWEERWIRDEGYEKIIPEALKGFMEKYNVRMNDFDKVIISCPSAGVIRRALESIGMAPSALVNNMMDNIGDTGSAHPLMLLVSILEKARAHEKILVAGYGSGTDVLAFEVTDRVLTERQRLGVKGHIKRKQELGNYQKYLVFRDLIPVDTGIRGEEIPPVRLSVTYREGTTLSCLCGSQCKICGTPQYPKQRVCVNPDCGAMDEMADYYFCTREGKIKSFTGDNLAFSINPPSIYGLIDFQGGGRLYLDIADASLDSLRVGMPVKMTLRRRYSDKLRGVYAYFWKATPIQDTFEDSETKKAEVK